MTEHKFKILEFSEAQKYKIEIPYGHYVFICKRCGLQMNIVKGYQLSDYTYPDCDVHLIKTVQEL